MKHRYVARIVVILVVAALPIVGLASSAAAKEIHFKGSVAELKRNCAGTYEGSATSGTCTGTTGVTVCTDVATDKNGNNCTRVQDRKVPKQRWKEIGDVLNFLLLSSTSGGPGQPTTGGNPGGSGSTNTPGTKPTGTTATTTTTKPTTTTTKPNVIQ